jgi:hypothetical protein
MIGVVTQSRAWRPGGRRPGHPRHRTVRHRRRPVAAAPELAPWRPAGGIAPRLSDAELVTLAVMQALLGFTSEARWLRHTGRRLRHLFPYLPGQSGYNKRLRRAAELLRQVIRAIACDTALWSDDVWVVDSIPVECGRSRETAKRSALAGWRPTGAAPATRASSGTAAASGVHPRRPAGRSRVDRRQGRRAPGAAGPADRRGGTGDGVTRAAAGRQALLRPPVRARAFGVGPAAVAAGPQGRAGAGRRGVVQPLRQLIESVNQTFKSQLDLEATAAALPSGSLCGSCSASSRPDRRHLAQRQDRPGDPTATDRL